MSDKKTAWRDRQPNRNIYGVSILDPFKRHPRWGIATFFIIMATFLLLASDSTPPEDVSLRGCGGSAGVKIEESDGVGMGKKFSHGSLADILVRHEAVYQDTIKRRAGLISQRGGLNQVQMYVVSAPSFRCHPHYPLLPHEPDLSRPLTDTINSIDSLSLTTARIFIPYVCLSLPGVCM